MPKMKRRVKDESPPISPVPGFLPRRSSTESEEKRARQTTAATTPSPRGSRLGKLVCLALALYALLYVYFEILLETDEWSFTADDWNAIYEKLFFEYGDFASHEASALQHLHGQCQGKGRIEPALRLEHYLNSWSRYFKRDGSLKQINVDFNSSLKYSVTPNLPDVPLEKPFCYQAAYWAAYNQKLMARLDSGATSRYRRDFAGIVEASGLENTSFLVAFGDGSLRIPHFPLLGKTRVVGDKSTVLLKLNLFRHFQSISTVVRDDVMPFKHKRRKAVWRGVTTGRGKGQRAALLRRLPQLQQSPVLDVGYNRIVQGMNISKQFFRRGMSRKRLLTYKMVIIAEGNDVSSGLKWALLSTSAVLMPPPTFVSWLMEDNLRPWVHYVPVKQDFSDLERQALWCLEHEPECEKIGLNGRCYMQQFLDRESERKIQNSVMTSVYKLYKAARFPVCKEL